MSRWALPIICLSTLILAATSEDCLSDDYSALKFLGSNLQDVENQLSSEMKCAKGFETDSLICENFKFGKIAFSGIQSQVEGDLVVDRVVVTYSLAFSESLGREYADTLDALKGNSSYKTSEFGAPLGEIFIADDLPEVFDLMLTFERCIYPYAPQEDASGLKLSVPFPMAVEYPPNMKCFRIGQVDGNRARIVSVLFSDPGLFSRGKPYAGGFSGFLIDSQMTQKFTERLSRMKNGITQPPPAAPSALGLEYKKYGDRGILGLFRLPD